MVAGISTRPDCEKPSAPEHVWLPHGVRRDPFAASHDTVRVHVITANKYRGGRLYVWLPGQRGRFIEASGEEPAGVLFDVALSGAERHLFAFKAVTQAGQLEDDAANRLWTSDDGGEIWTHGDTDAVVSSPPAKCTVTVHYRQEAGLDEAPTLHVWGTASDFVADVPGAREPGGTWRFSTPALYSGHEYRFKFFNAEVTDDERRWEHSEAERRILIGSNDVEFWTLEGDHELYEVEPR